MQRKHFQQRMGDGTCRRCGIPAPFLSKEKTRKAGLTRMYTTDFLSHFRTPAAHSIHSTRTTAFLHSFVQKRRTVALLKIHYTHAQTSFYDAPLFVSISSEWWIMEDSKIFIIIKNFQRSLFCLPQEQHYPHCFQTLV